MRILEYEYRIVKLNYLFITFMLITLFCLPLKYLKRELLVVFLNSHAHDQYT